MANKHFQKLEKYKVERVAIKAGGKTISVSKEMVEALGTIDKEGADVNAIVEDALVSFGVLSMAKEIIARDEKKHARDEKKLANNDSSAATDSGNQTATSEQ